VTQRAKSSWLSAEWASNWIWCSKNGVNDRRQPSLAQWHRNANDYSKENGYHTARASDTYANFPLLTWYPSSYLWCVNGNGYSDDEIGGEAGMLLWR
jgi:hypothetical protein